MFTNYLLLALILKASNAIPLPAVITRVHTAEAVTVTNTYTTGTTTVQLPAVEVLVSNGATYTYTLTDQLATTAYTYTTTYSDTETTNNDVLTSVKVDVVTVTAGAETATPTTAETTQQTTSTSPTTTSSPTTNSPTTTASPSTTSLSTSTSTPATTSSTSTQATTSTTTSSSTSSGAISPPDTIVYSPYTDDGGCKDSSTIQSDLDYIKSKGINKLRIYGCDCGNWDTILPYCVKIGLTVNQGFWISDEGVDSINDDITAFISYGQASGWDVFDVVTVGNEAISAGYVSALELLAKIKSVKSQLSDAGYSGDLTTSEPPDSFIDNPTLCTDSGIAWVGVNAHSYFDGSETAGNSGPFVIAQKQLVIDACNGMTAYITETGYPSKGDTNGLQVPSAANQEAAIKSIISSTGGDCTILTTYNDFWKDPGAYGIEQYFGTISLFD